MNAIIENPPEAEWGELIKRPGLNSENLFQTVSEIINTVKVEGDFAVKNYSLKFHDFAPEDLWVTEEEIANSKKAIDKNLKKAILLAKKNIEKFHKQQVGTIKKIETSHGVFCWRKSVAIGKVGLYIPGGSAPLFSTLLMLAIPAKLAGCKKIIVTTPANKNGNVDLAILFVANILGIENIYKGGGAQAIAALAYGTQTVEKVYKIFGPGNQYVTAAKKIVNNDGVAIDMLAGPSELAVYADKTCVPAYVAADLLSQAEHGADSQVILVAVNQQIIKNVILEIHKQLPSLSRKEIIEKSFLNRRFIVMKNVDDAFDFLNNYAPEHLIIASENAEKLAEKV
ncbi:MAG: histidinol dehydrogenase, partial [Ginsengibacter sp.]